jgi:hypothetical protein
VTRAIGWVATLLLSAAFCRAAPPPDVHERAIRYFGGKVVAPTKYAASEAGFASYLRDTGLSSISAADLTDPHHPRVAEKYGYKVFLPVQAWWPRAAALGLVAQQIEKLIGQQVRIRNWWRPQPYNLDKTVGGAPRSDHVTAHAIDIDYQSVASCARAIEWLRELRVKQRWLRLSLGTGPLVTHVGIDSPVGSREWVYVKKR